MAYAGGMSYLSGVYPPPPDEPSHVRQLSCRFKSVLHSDTGSSAISILIDELVAKPLTVNVGRADNYMVMLIVSIVMTSHDIRAFRYIVSSL